MSETEDKSKTNPEQDNPTDDKKGEKDTSKTFTQEELDAKVSERLKRDREKRDKEVADLIKKERDEWERQAKLSQEEKEAEERKKREAETADREREITLRENRADARERLQEKNISTDLVDFVVDVDADKTKENIDNLEKAFLKAVEKGVDDKLKGDTPKYKSTNKGTDVPTYSGTTVL